MIDEIKQKTEKAIKAMPVLIDTYSSKLSDIKRRIEREVDRKELNSELAKLRALRRKARVEVMGERNELMRSFHNARVELRSRVHKMPAGKLKDALEDMDVKLDKLDGHIKDELDDVRGKLELFYDRVDDVQGKIEDKIRKWERKMD